MPSLPVKSRTVFEADGASPTANSNSRENPRPWEAREIRSKREVAPISVTTRAYAKPFGTARTMRPVLCRESGTYVRTQWSNGRDCARAPRAMVGDLRERAGEGVRHPEPAKIRLRSPGRAHGLRGKGACRLRCPTRSAHRPRSQRPSSHRGSCSRTSHPRLARKREVECRGSANHAGRPSRPLA